MATATTEYSRRVSDNPNDAIISVEFEEDGGAFPFYIDGTGAQFPPVFRTFEEAKAAVDKFVEFAE